MEWFLNNHPEYKEIIAHTGKDSIKNCNIGDLQTIHNKIQPQDGFQNSHEFNLLIGVIISAQKSLIHAKHNVLTIAAFM